MMKLVLRIFCLLFCLAVPSAKQTQSEEHLDIGSQRELFVDGFLIERMTGSYLYLHHPQPAETAIQVDRPWEGGDNLGISVLHHDGIYRMYYRGMASDDTKGRCYAESPDGITWTKPSLGLIEVAGTLDNNAIVEGRDSWSYFMIPFLDLRPGVSPSRLMKGLTPGFSRKGNQEIRKLFLHVSSDGFRWEKVQDSPILSSSYPNAFDSIVCVFWSVAEDQYVLFSRYMVDEHGRPSRKGGRRSLFRSASKDLYSWTEPIPMTYTGTGVVPSDQLYTSMTVPYFRAPHIYVSFPMRFMEGRRVVSDEQARWIGLKPGRNSDCSDGVLMTTRAGSTHFEWIFREAFLRPGLGFENWGTRSNITLWGLHPTGDSEMSIWVNRHYGTPSYHVRRYRMRTDGFVSVRTPYEGGELLTRPFCFQGKKLEINYSTSAAGAVFVEILDSSGQPIPGYSQKDSQEIIGDEISHIVSWKGGNDVSSLIGEPIRLRFIMKDADLYSLRFK